MNYCIAISKWFRDIFLTDEPVNGRGYQNEGFVPSLETRPITPSYRNFNNEQNRQKRTHESGTGQLQIAKTSEKSRKGNTKKSSKNKKAATSPPHVDGKEKDISDEEMASVLCYKPNASGSNRQHTSFPTPQSTTLQTRHRTNADSQSPKYLKRPGSIENPAVRETTTSNWKTKNISNSASPQKNYKLSSGLSATELNNSGNYASKKEYHTVSSNHINVDGLPQPISGSSNYINIKTNQDSKDIPPPILLNIKVVSEQKNNPEISKQENGNHVVNINEDENVTIRKKASPSNSHRNKIHSQRQEFFKDLVPSEQKHDQVDITISSGRDKTQYKNVLNLPDQNEYGFNIKTEHQDVQRAHSTIVTPNSPLISDLRTSEKNTQQLAKFTRNSYSADQNKSCNPIDCNQYSPLEDQYLTSYYSHVNYKPLPLAPPPPKPERNLIHEIDTELNLAIENTKSTIDINKRENELLKKSTAENDSFVKSGAAHNLENERIIKTNDNQSLKTEQEIETNGNGDSNNIVEISTNVSDKLTSETVTMHGELTHNSVKSLPNIPLTGSSIHEKQFKSILPISTTYEEIKKETDNSLSAKEDVASTFNINSKNLETPHTTPTEFETKNQQNSNIYLTISESNTERKQPFVNVDTNSEVTKARKDIIESLKRIRDNAVPFEEEIYDFTELENSNKYYYIEKSLTRLIDNLDDMHEIIVQDNDLRDKRKKVYKYIFGLLDLLDEKLEKNKQAKR